MTLQKEVLGETAARSAVESPFGWGRGREWGAIGFPKLIQYNYREDLKVKYTDKIYTLSPSVIIGQLAWIRIVFCFIQRILLRQHYFLSRGQGFKP